MKTFRLRLGSLVLAGSLILGFADRLAADETPVNAYTSNNQRDPSVAMNLNGDFVVVWESFGQSGGSFPLNDIYAQRFDVNGDPVGEEFPISAISWDQRNPAVAMDDDGNIAVVFESGNSQSIYQIVVWRNASSVFFVDTGTPITKENPSIAMTGFGRFVVAWQSWFGGSSEIYARRFKQDGSPLADRFTVNTTTEGNQRDASIGMDNSSNFLVAWESQGGQDGDGSGIFAQVYKTNGTPTEAGELQVNTTTAGDQTKPAAAMAYVTGRGVVVWESSSGGNLNTYDVFARRINLGGTLEGDEFLVNTTTESYQGRPSVAMDAAGNFVVAWDSQGQDGSHGGVYAQRFDYNGDPLGGEFLVNTTTAGSQTSPAVAADISTGSYVAAWQGPDGDGDGVFMSWPAPEPSSALLQGAALLSLMGLAAMPGSLQRQVGNLDG